MLLTSVSIVTQQWEQQQGYGFGGFVGTTYHSVVPAFIALGSGRKFTGFLEIDWQIAAFTAIFSIFLPDLWQTNQKIYASFEMPEMTDFFSC